MRTSAPANFGTLLEVHRSGDSGSPRVDGSTSRSRSSTTPGSVSLIGLRPPPARRTRPGSGRSPASSSAIPRRIVLSPIPVTRATSATPTAPCERASAAAHSRRRRSSHSDPNSRQRTRTFSSVTRASASFNLSGGSTTHHRSPPRSQLLYIKPAQPPIDDRQALSSRSTFSFTAVRGGSYRVYRPADADNVAGESDYV